VPVVEFERESFMAGGAANVARNLTALGVRCELFGALGPDHAARVLRRLLKVQDISSEGLLQERGRQTSLKTRIVAQQQQVVRLDRESCALLNAGGRRRLLARVEAALPSARTQSSWATTARAS
jgi:bifunctional ADP-heptose synthase (sugar kinase/adenylyltransferase)